MDRTLMKCGCVAQGVLKAIHGKPVEPPILACLVHDCYEPQTDLPDLSARSAQCAYLPRGHAVKPSSFDLPFFEYLGPGSPESRDKCKCGMSVIAHYPRWLGKIRVIRRWYKTERSEQITTKECHAPDETAAKAKFEQDADFFRVQQRDKDTEVFSAEVLSVEPTRSPTKCKEFRAAGPAEFDKFYCGCHGWD